MTSRATHIIFDPTLDAKHRIVEGGSESYLEGPPHILTILVGRLLLDFLENGVHEAVRILKKRDAAQESADKISKAVIVHFGMNCPGAQFADEDSPPDERQRHIRVPVVHDVVGADQLDDVIEHLQHAFDDGRSTAKALGLVERDNVESTFWETLHGIEDPVENLDDDLSLWVVTPLLGVLELQRGRCGKPSILLGYRALDVS